MHVTCSGVVRIKSGGRYVMFISDGRWAPGSRDLVLTPFGGMLNATPKGLKQLKAQFDATSLPGSGALDFIAPDEYLEALDGWFRANQGGAREPTPKALLTEQLIRNELFAPSELPQGAIALVPSGPFSRLVGRVQEPKPGYKTVSLVAVYDAVIDTVMRSRLVERGTQGKKPTVYLATAAEIQRGYTLGDVSLRMHPYASCLLGS